MKKRNLLFALATLICLFCGGRTSAQITGLIVEYGDSLTSFCKIPMTRHMTIYVAPIGIPLSGDSASIYVNFGDGSDTTFKLGFGPGPIRTTVNHRYTFGGSFGSKAIASMPSGVADTFEGPVRTLTNTCGTLNGQLYVDSDLDCVKDAAEPGVFWMPILAVNTATADTIYAGWSNDSGYYSVDLLPGTYTIIPNAYYRGWGLVADTNIIPSCPTTGTYTLTVAAGGSYTKDFAYKCKTIISYDAYAFVSSRGFVPGDSTPVSVWVGAPGWYFPFTCASLSATVTLTLDPKLSYSSIMSGPAPSSISGSTITWTLASAKDVVRFMSSIWVKVPTTATIGDTIRMSVHITTSPLPDPDLSNNTYNFKRAVTSSYDPNMKEVSPTGDGTPGYIPNNTKLMYVIHFQNTGTAPAKNITVADDLDNNLDINTLHLLNTTHNASLHVEGRMVKFRFENINLPDSGTNRSASMGSIIYSIMPKKDLRPGTPMKNKAAIYFDYNAPIITNTTVNTTVIPTLIETVTKGSLTARVFPNPAHTTLNIKLENNNDFSVQIMDMLGHNVANQNTNTNTMTIPIEALPSGIYLLSIKDTNGNELNTKVVIKH